MKTIDFLVKMLYADWFIILMLVYMSIAPLFMIRKHIPNAKKFFIRLLSVVTAALLSFYFMFPVPVSVQEQEVEFVHNLKNNNDKAVTINMQYWLSNHCNSRYLQGYQYFMFVKAFRKDFDATMDAQKMVSLGGIEDRDNYKGSYICDLKL